MRITFDVHHVYCCIMMNLSMVRKTDFFLCLHIIYIQLAVMAFGLIPVMTITCKNQKSVIVSSFLTPTCHRPSCQISVVFLTKYKRSIVKFSCWMHDYSNNFHVWNCLHGESKQLLWFQQQPCFSKFYMFHKIVFIWECRFLKCQFVPELIWL